MVDIINYTSPNYSIREAEDVLQYIILHFTEVDKHQSLQLLASKEGGVSCHYLIDEKGEILELVSPQNIAWHAGKSRWGGRKELNKYSIGIELVNSGKKQFADQQISILLELLKYLTTKYNIISSNIIGHSDIAPDRKIDPGPFFPWGILAENGLGLWHNISEKTDSAVLYYYGDKGSGVEQLQRELSNLGYAIDITAIFDQQTNYVIRSFISHFCSHIIVDKLGLDHYWQEDSRYFWSEEMHQILVSLLQSKNLLQ